MEQKA